jgi:hypothetical protein
MADYYGVLTRKIREAIGDPAKVRELVYECSRLALRRQVLEQRQQLSAVEANCHIDQLEGAIDRLKTETADAGASEKREPNHAATRLELNRLANQESNRGETIETDPTYPEQTFAESAGLEAVAASLIESLNAGRPPSEQATDLSAPLKSRGAPCMTAEFGRQPPESKGSLAAAEASPGRGDHREPEPDAHAEGETASHAVSPTGSLSRRLGNSRERGGVIVVAAILARDEGKRDLQLGQKIATREPGEYERGENVDARNREAILEGDDQGSNNVPHISQKPYRRKSLQLKHVKSGGAHSEGDERGPIASAAPPDCADAVKLYSARDPSPAKMHDLQDVAEAVRERREDELAAALARLAARHQHSHEHHAIEDDDALDDDALDDENDSPRRRWDPFPADLSDVLGSRELIMVPDRPKSLSQIVSPHDFVRRLSTYEVVSEPRSRTPIAMYGLVVAFQIVIAALAIPAFYFAVWGRPLDRPIPSALPDQTANALAVTASLGVPTVEAALSFPRPSAYGVYAVRDNQLVELEQVHATPVDPRLRTQLQLVQPSRTVIDTAKIAFVVFRRDLVSSAPEKVPVRIASRIAHSMIFDSGGKPMVTTPPTDTWLIRDQGYDMRVSPLRDSPEMVMLRPENPEFSFPSGRYELMIIGQPYDFVVPGEVTDPAHCVEGVATARGPVFYECKSTH